MNLLFQSVSGRFSCVTNQVYAFIPATCTSKISSVYFYLENSLLSVCKRKSTVKARVKHNPVLVFKRSLFTQKKSEKSLPVGHLYSLASIQTFSKTILKICHLHPSAWSIAWTKRDRHAFVNVQKYVHPLSIFRSFFPVTHSFPKVRNSIQRRSYSIGNLEGAETNPNGEINSVASTYIEVRNQASKLMKFFMSGATAGTAAALVGVGLYFYHFSPGKEWPIFLRELFSVIDERRARELEKGGKNLKQAKEVQEAIENLIKLLGNEPSQKIIENLIKGARKQFKEKMKQLRSDHSVAIHELKNKHSEEKQKLENAHKEELNNAIKIEKTKLDQITKNYELVKQQHLKEIAALNGKFEATAKRLQEQHEKKIEELKNDHAQSMVDLKEENVRMRQELTFYAHSGPDKECLANSKILIDSGKTGKVTYPENYRFSPNFIALLTGMLKTDALPYITELDFYGTYIRSNQGVTSLMAGLEANTTIKKLNLGYSSISNADASAIAKMLGCNHTLKELNLHRTWLSDTGADVLLQALKGNEQRLEKLILTNTYVSDAKKQEMREILKITIE
jgi:hypothetical protein